MNDMRDHIAGIIFHRGQSCGFKQDTITAADAILAALPDMIKPLVWYRLKSTGDRNVHEAKGFLARYTAWPDGRWRLYGYNVGGISLKGNLAGAQEDAYAYEQAAIMSRFNIGEVT
jgi:hypothetical protein